MVINFPNSPSNGQTFVVGNRTFQYNSTKARWEIVVGTLATDISDLTDTGGVLGSGGATVYADMTALIAATGMSNGDQALVQATNKLYMYSGTGWYLIATIQNDAPSAITGVNGTYELAIDGTTTTITAVSTDPEGFPLTWSYSTSGLGSIATISNIDNVFTITPSTTEADAGSFSLTINATDGVNGAVSTSTSLTLEFIVTVTNSNYTTLLATATGTSDNNNITDASANSHTITVSGDAHAGTFSPYRSGGYSTYFDGTGDYLRTPTINLSGNFTIEFFINLNAITTDVGIFSFGALSSTNSILELYNNTSGQFRLYSSSGGELGASSAVEANKWYHVAITRSSNTFKAYLDGVEFADDTTARTINSAITIGGYVNTSYLMNGHIRDFRITTNIEYPSNNFTPPSEPLTAITGTVLLTCHLPYIADGSTNDHTITVNGDPETKPFSPYDYLEYSATNHGGSINFDGTGDDYLTIPDHSSLNFASNDWTIECWIYPRTNVGDCGIWHQSASGTDWYSIYLDGAFNLKFVFYNASNGIEWAGTAAANTAPQNTWTHVALVRQFGTGFYLYANGKLIASDITNASVAMEDKTHDHVIGHERYVGNGQDFDGLISDFKMDIGTAHYTGEFTPPTAPLSSSGADMHIKGTDASIIDKSQSNNLKLVGNVDNGWGLDKFITSQQAVEFNGSNQYLTVAGNSDFDFGSNDFTIEAWVYTDSSNEQIITSGRPSGESWIFLNKMSSSNTIRILISTDGSSWAVNSTSTETMTLSRWNHISVSRDGSTINMYLNGRLIISTSISGSIHYNTSQKIAIGSGQNDSADRTWNGYISDFRIINGTAVVPPVNGPNEALTEVTNTKLLTCRPSGASITDLSTTGTTHTITSISSTAATYASPFGKAMHFDGTGDRATATGVPDLGDDFTIECWVYATASGNKAIVSSIDNVGGGSSSGYWSFGLALGGSNYQLQTDVGSYGESNTGVLYNQWVHLAVTRTSNTIRYFINGTLDSNTVSNSSTLTNPSGIVIGSSPNNNYIYNFTGYIQDLRISNECKYTANFTPPTASLEG